MKINELFKKDNGPRPYRKAEEVLADQLLHGPYLVKTDSAGTRIYKAVDMVTERMSGMLTIRLGRDVYCPETILDEYRWQDGSPAGVND